MEMEIEYEDYIERIMEENELMKAEKGQLQDKIEQAKNEAEQAKIKGIKKALKRGKLTVEEIAEDFEVTVDYVLEIKATIL